MKTIRQDLVKRMKSGQRNVSVASTAAVLAKTDHPLLKLVMEIIRRDLSPRARPQFIIDTVETKPVTPPPTTSAESRRCSTSTCGSKTRWWKR
jgi:hypothetical protein